MPTDMDPIDEAIRCIKTERTSVETETDAFRAFRETVSRARPHRTDGDAGTSTARLAECYRETVMVRTAYERRYGDDLADSLAVELSPSLADALLDDTALTQRRKRDLLLATTRTIDERESFSELLATELDSLAAIRNDLQEITDTLETLPPCSLHTLSFGEYAETWAATEGLLDECEQLIQERQAALTDTTRPVRPDSTDAHDLSEYLYADLDTPYPALRSIAETHEHVQRFRDPQRAADSSDVTPRSAPSPDDAAILNGSTD